MLKRNEAIANFVYAGTNKYCTHALDGGINGKKTECGMSVSELMSRKNAEWEIVESDGGRYNSEPIIIGCIKCQRSAVG